MYAVNVNKSASIVSKLVIQCEVVSEKFTEAPVAFRQADFEQAHAATTCLEETPIFSELLYFASPCYCMLVCNTSLNLHCFILVLMMPD